MWGFKSTSAGGSLKKNLRRRRPDMRPLPETPPKDPAESDPGTATPQFQSEAFRHLRNTLSCFCFNRAATQIVTGGFDGMVHLHDMARPVPPRIKVKAHDHVRGIFLTEDERHLFTCGSDRLVKMFDYPSMNFVSQFKTRTRALCLLVHRPYKLLFCGTYTGRICAWNYETGSTHLPFKEVPKQHDRLVLCMTRFHHTFLSGSEDRSVKQWDMRTGQMIAVVNFPYRISNIRVLQNPAGQEEKEQFLFQHHIHCELHSLRRRRRGSGAPGAIAAETPPIIADPPPAPYGKKGKKKKPKKGKRRKKGTQTAEDIIIEDPADGGRRLSAAEVSISKISKDHMFLSITNFSVMANDRVLIGWNQLLGRLEFWDIARRALLHHVKLQNAVFLRNFTCVQPRVSAVFPPLPTPPPPPPPPAAAASSSAMATPLASASASAPSASSDDQPLLAETPIMGLVAETGSAATVPRGPSDMPSPNSFVYYIVGRDLDRVEIDREVLLRKQERNAEYDVRQAYLTYQDVFGYFTKTLSYSPVLVAQAIEHAAERKRISPAYSVSVQVDRLMGVLEAEIVDESLVGGAGGGIGGGGGLDETIVRLRTKADFSRIVVENMHPEWDVYRARELLDQPLRARRTLFFQKLYERSAPDRSGDKFSLLIRKDHVFEDALRMYLKDGFMQKVHNTAIVISLAVGQSIENCPKDDFLSRVVGHIIDTLFVPVAGSKCYFQPKSDADIFKHFEESDVYKGAGRILGHCLYHQIRVPFHVPYPVFKVLCGMALEYNDLDKAFPVLAKKLDRILEMSEEDEGSGGPGLIRLHFHDQDTRSDLIEGGSEVEVGPGELHLYARKFAEHRLVNRVEDYIKAFVGGFNEVIPMDHLKAFQAPSEVEVLLCGHKEVSVDRWEKSCIFSNCTKSTGIVQWFFEIVRSDLSLAERSKLLYLITGEYDVPPGGFEPVAMICRVGLKNLYDELRKPKVNAKLNTLELPSYVAKAQMLRAIKGLLAKNSHVRM